MLLQETRLRKQTFERGIHGSTPGLPATHPSSVPSSDARRHASYPHTDECSWWLLAVQALPVLLLLSTVRKI